MAEGWFSLAKCLLCRHEDLNLTPGLMGENLGMVACACNPSVREMETGRSLKFADQLV